MTYWSESQDGVWLLGRVANATDPGWIDRAVAAIMRVGTRGVFTASEVWQELGEAPTRRLGPLMIALAKGGVIECVGRTVPNRERWESHGAPVSRWRLLRQIEGLATLKAGGQQSLF